MELLTRTFFLTQRLLERRKRSQTAQTWLILSTAVALSACQLMFSDAEIVSGHAHEEVCATYCQTIGEVCSDSQSQYASTQQCEDVCFTLALGAEDDQIGNTIHCRLHYAGEASENPTSHCHSAGPGGNGVCGSNCESFCHIQNEVCFGENAQYPTITECIADCSTFDTSVTYSPGTTTGDSFACRLTHLALAASSPDVHCSHISPNSPVCK